MFDWTQSQMFDWNTKSRLFSDLSSYRKDAIFTYLESVSGRDVDNKYFSFFGNGGFGVLANGRM